MILVEYLGMDDVLKLLKDKDIQYIPSGKDYVIHCLNPQHPDRHPSLRIDRLKGIGQCLSCGFKVNLFKQYNVQTDGRGAKVIALKEKIAKLMSDSIGLSLPPKGSPRKAEFRGLSRETLAKVGAFEWPDYPNRVVFPMYSPSGKLICFNARAIANENPKYKIIPEGVTLPMYPGKPSPIDNTIIIVEGAIDYLNLLDKGVTNAIAIMGVTSLHNQRGLNQTKVGIFKMAGVTKITLMLDGDDAGRKATEELQPLLENYGFLVNVIELKEGQDPGDLSASEIEEYLKPRQP
jgi:DNA primase